MGFVNLKEMAKRAKMTEEKIMELVEIGVIQPQKSYCHPGDFGDGREIAFIPEEALVDIKEAKSRPIPEPESKVEAEEEERDDEEEEKGDPEADELKKKKKERLKMVAAEKAKKKSDKK